MKIKGQPVFTWPIDWTESVNGRWQYDLRELLLGFGPELIDPKQDHVVHGWTFQTDFRNEAITEIDAFLDALNGRAKRFWMPGPSAEFKILDDRNSTSFLIAEQGAETGWQLKPGGYLYFTKPGEEPQVAQIASVVDYGDGTELVTITELEREESSSLSSVNSSSSTEASLTTSSDSSASSQSSESSSSKSSVNSSLSGSSVSTSSASSLSSSSLSSSHSQSSSSTQSASSASSLSSSSTNPSASLSSSSSAWLSIDETWRVSALVLVRMAADEEKMEVMAERWQRRSFTVVEVPHEYDLLPAITEPSKPIFLYRFTAPLPDGNIVWRYTSHPVDVTLQAAGDQSSSSTAAELTSSSLTSESSPESVSFTSLSSASSENSSSSTERSLTSTSESHSSSSTVASLTSQSSSSGPESDTTWLAVGIEHGRISRSMKFGGTASITADYDEVEPLRLCVPMRLAAPLRVEILKTTIALTEPEVLFDGMIRQPELNGRKIKVACVEWGDVMEGKVPDFFIQRDCNYRVYDAFTCRADKPSKTYSVNIIAVAGRLAVISGTGLAGLAADWFAQGWVEFGTGLERRTLFVASSTAAAGNQITLSLTTAVTVELPVAATAIAGCDRRRSTCIAKFDNLINFGGHAPPRDNLVLVAVRSVAGTGGKK